MDLLTIRKCQPASSNIAAGKTAHDAKAQAKPQEVRGYVDLGQAADRLHGTETSLEEMRTQATFHESLPHATRVRAWFASGHENASTADSHCHIPITVVAEEFRSPLGTTEVLFFAQQPLM